MIELHLLDKFLRIFCSLHYLYLFPIADNMSQGGGSNRPAPGIGSNQNIMSNSQMNGTQGSQVSQSNTANLKGKLQALEEMILQLADELQYHKKEVQVLRSEKETLESVLTMKT